MAYLITGRHDVGWRRRGSIALLLGGLASGGAALACSSGDNAVALPDAGAQSGTNGGGELATNGASDPGPELELEENFRSPVVSGPFLWSANPDSNRVAILDARSRDVVVLDGGHAPTFLAALPAGKRPGGALVLNVLSHDASVFRFKTQSVEEGALASGTEDVEQQRLPVQEGASAWAVGASGDFAIAWSLYEEDLLGPLDGYQDLSVLDLRSDDASVNKISVGFRPTQVQINATETRAYVVSDPGISVIDLSLEQPRVIHELFLPEEVTGQKRDVSFTPDGRLAFVRLGGRAEVLIVETESDNRVTVHLPKEVTDLDLSEDGSLAVAVMRGTLDALPGTDLEPELVGGLGGQGGDQGLGGAPGGGDESASLVALLPADTIFDEPGVYEQVTVQELVGSAVVSFDGSRVVLYTSAAANPRMTLLDSQQLSYRVVDLKAPAQAVFLSADGAYATAVMTPPAGSDRAGAFALVPVDEDLPVRIEGTSTVPRFVSHYEERCLVTTWGSETTPAVSYLGRFPELSVDRVELSSEPLAGGMVPQAGQGFVAQAHGEGRVTFIDLNSGDPSTVTGFELASKVVEQ